MGPATSGRRIVAAVTATATYQNCLNDHKWGLGWSARAVTIVALTSDNVRPDVSVFALDVVQLAVQLRLDSDAVVVDNASLALTAAIIVLQLSAKHEGRGVIP